ncbi:HAMP domain-containing histidine kinase [Clostridium sp. YIM B02515]|uniref:histidine kinase n=1 Tax=Clostridium rhizosphaerae TaxID=2803861 RepID=A0ABS1TBB2_9CLOT|nr:HAMP domain-containing sensor histidine kinase [Clostridium rhizosphaerae]MBL4935614.1 HAMP domain-containing histidine kinase [Clostridium rhizosphaerae]
MFGNVPLIKLNSKNSEIKKIPIEYKEELQLQLLKSNLQKEAVLSFMFLLIGTFLPGMRFISKFWNIDRNIYCYFFYLHMALLIAPFAFLAALFFVRNDIASNIKLCKWMHRIICFFLLAFCAIISIQNRNIDRLPFPYLIIMFYITFVIFLDKKERYFVYIISYMIYIIGCVVLGADIYHSIRNALLITFLIIMALKVSNINYCSFATDFINNKLILDKNKELDKLLKQRTKELNETMEYEKLRAAFFANISHELRTPLNVIFSAEQMIDLTINGEIRNYGKEDIKKYSKLIKQNCYRLIRLVANLIDITKIDAGYFQVNLENSDIIKVVEDITLSVAAFAEQRDLILVFDTEIEELTIACDPDKIERIMLNLLSNAVKFTPKGGSIFVNIYEKADSISIVVKDTGIGIPENMRQSIFERFVQVDRSISRNQEGSGIGLSLVKSLVDLHGGTISLVSEEGKGSKFTIELPKRTVDKNAEVQDGAFIDVKQNVEKIEIEFSDIYE